MGSDHQSHLYNLHYNCLQFPWLAYLPAACIAQTAQSVDDILYMVTGSNIIMVTLKMRSTARLMDCRWLLVSNVSAARRLKCSEVRYLFAGCTELIQLKTMAI